MSEFTLLEVIPVGNILGECMLWDEVTGCAWWTDIHGRRLHRYHLANKKLQVFELPTRLCAFGFVDKDERLVGAFAEGFAYYTPGTGELDWLTQPESGFTGTRFNDGRVDRQGRFWSGTMVENAPATDAAGNAVTGSLYCLTGDQAQKRLGEIRISNSLCWSPDAATAYFADSPTGVIRAFDFDAASGSLGNARDFVRVPDGSAPDGSVIDSKGCLWNAHWGGGRVVRYSPQGDVLAELALPVTQPTCICFGGPDLDLLFVTTATENLDDAALAQQPEAGHVFVYRTPFKGLPESRYRLA
ncbi:MAG: SMP-30/gluconolactonase/LRE family protein [Pseudohongiellaceae bacterium]